MSWKKKQNPCKYCKEYDSDDDCNEYNDQKGCKTKVINCKPNVIVRRPKIIQCEPTIIKYKPEIVKCRPKIVKWYKPTVTYCETETKKIGCKPKITCKPKNKCDLVDPIDDYIDDGDYYKRIDEN
jgi:hypothetical protein